MWGFTCIEAGDEVEHEAGDSWGPHGAGSYQ